MVILISAILSIVPIILLVVGNAYLGNPLPSIAFMPIGMIIGFVSMVYAIKITYR